MPATRASASLLTPPTPGRRGPSSGPLPPWILLGLSSTLTTCSRVCRRQYGLRQPNPPAQVVALDRQLLGPASLLLQPPPSLRLQRPRRSSGDTALRQKV